MIVTQAFTPCLGESCIFAHSQPIFLKEGHSHIKTHMGFDSTRQRRHACRDWPRVEHGLRCQRQRMEGPWASPAPPASGDVGWPCLVCTWVAAGPAFLRGDHEEKPLSQDVLLRFHAMSPTGTAPITIGLRAVSHVLR